MSLASLETVDSLSVEGNPLYKPVNIGGQTIRTLFNSKLDYNIIDSVERLTGRWKDCDPRHFTIGPFVRKYDKRFQTTITISNVSFELEFYVEPQIRFYAMIGSEMTTRMFFNLKHCPTLKFGTPMDVSRRKNSREFELFMAVEEEVKTFHKALKKTLKFNRNVLDMCSHRFCDYFSSFDPVSQPVSDVLSRFGNSSYFTKLYLDSPLRRLSDECPHLLTAILRDIFGDEEDHVSTYMGSIIVYSDSFQDHIRDVKSVISKLTHDDLALDIGRCDFLVQQDIILGVLVSHGTFRANPSKVSGIVDGDRPVHAGEMRSFLGKTNAIRDFIPHYATLSKPLEHLRYAKGKIRWNDETAAAFRKLRYATSNTLTLYHMEAGVQEIIYLDVLNETISAVLGFESEVNTIATQDESIPKCRNYYYQFQNLRSDQPKYFYPVKFLSRTLSQYEQDEDEVFRTLSALYHTLNSWDSVLSGDRFIVRSVDDLPTRSFVRKYEDEASEERLEFVNKFAFSMQVIFEEDNVLRHCLKSIEAGGENN